MHAFVSLRMAKNSESATAASVHRAKFWTSLQKADESHIDLPMCGNGWNFVVTIGQPLFLLMCEILLQLPCLFFNSGGRRLIVMDLRMFGL
jgi:hypothetical protein